MSAVWFRTSSGNLGRRSPLFLVTDNQVKGTNDAGTWSAWAKLPCFCVFGRGETMRLTRSALFERGS